MTTTIEKTIEAARKAQPDLWERTEAVARIIDPGAFIGGYVIPKQDSRSLYETRRRYMQGTAMVKAQEVLRFLGVNTDTDWYSILDIMAEAERAARQETPTHD